MDISIKYAKQKTSIDVIVRDDEYELSNGTIYKLDEIDKLREEIEDYGEIHWKRGIVKYNIWVGELIDEDTFLERVKLVEGI